MPARRDGGELVIVLHTHMPYVEGFGTWPFGEEWLWEAMATCYLPLLGLLEDGAPLTLSLTPVLCDQLEAPGLGERFTRFAQEVRRETHRLDSAHMRAAGEHELARELERAGGDYERALARWRSLEGGLVGAFAPYARWTSSATHAVLPLLATEAGARLQVRGGIQAQRARFGEGWRGGFWLPECAHAPWLDGVLAEAGVHATCVDLTERFGVGAPEHLRPLAGEEGVVLVPIDRAVIELVWSERGYPSHAGYRDYHHHTEHRHHPWANDGRAYDPQRALALAREHAADFVARVRARLLAAAQSSPSGGLVVCALDTELLGHWWYEGIAWLEAVIDEATAQGLALTHLDDALERHAPVPAQWPDAASVTTWGQGHDLSTWTGPLVADLAWSARAAELRVLAAAPEVSEAAARQLLAIQSSDWAFLVARDLAAPYGRERAGGHLRELGRALCGAEGDPAWLRNLAVHADRAALLAP